MEKNRKEDLIFMSENIDFDSIFDLELSVEEYTDKLNELFKKNRLSIIEKRTILRQKVQEFKDKKHRHTADIRRR